MIREFVQQRLQWRPPLIWVASLVLSVSWQGVVLAGLPERHVENREHAMGVAESTECGVSESESQEWFESGRRISASAVAVLRRRLKSNGWDRHARFVVVAYCFWHRTEARELSIEGADLSAWWLTRCPGSILPGLGEFLRVVPEYGPENGKMWRAVVEKQPTNAKILDLAAQAFMMSDSAYAIELTTRARKVSPAEMRLALHLAELYALKSEDGKQTQNDALTAYRLYLEASSMAGAKQLRLEYAPAAARCALRAGLLDDARRLGQRMVAEAPTVKGRWDYGNLIHHGNNILGVVALRSGRMKVAIAYLDKAGETPGSPQLGSFGPSMGLARELLVRGERDAVLGYLESCGKFWKKHRGRLEEWKKTIRAGEMPDFGVNLRY